MKILQHVVLNPIRIMQAPAVSKAEAGTEAPEDVKITTLIWAPLLGSFVVRVPSYVWGP